MLLYSSVGSGGEWPDVEYDEEELADGFARLTIPGETVFDEDGKPVGIMLKNGRIQRLDAIEKPSVRKKHVKLKRKLALTGDF